jgi:hypothetical protein
VQKFTLNLSFFFFQKRNNLHCHWTVIGGFRRKSSTDARSTASAACCRVNGGLKIGRRAISCVRLALSPEATYNFF